MKDTSYGIILFTIRNNQVLFLVAKRRYTYSYIEFLFSKRERERRVLINNMTHREISQILGYKLERLWEDIYLEPFSYFSFKHSWKHSSFRRYMIEVFKESKRKYGEDLIATLSKESGNEDTKSPWEFPKGKPNKGETGLECALREFKEETGIDTRIFVRTAEEFFIENYIGEDDGVIYNSVLYPMFVNYDDLREESISSDNSHSHSLSGECVSPEIKLVRWMNEKECSKVLCETKMGFVERVVRKLKEMKKVR
jgi:8-oxo-dGTP pyrophosphatase MutT (NUDIX family)